jgi:molecular chaperone DnaJ
MAKDYYVILGIDPDATQEEIRSAYRREAKRCHPDVSGQGCEPFLLIKEAYDVLGDEARRRAYDAELARERKWGARTAREVGPEPLQRRRYPVEPLVPARRSGSYRDAFFERSFFSPFEEMLGRPWSDLDAPVRPETRTGAKDLHVTVTLSQEEARRGGRIRVSIPVQIRCPACRGRGGDGFFECPHCFGSGTVVDQYPIDVAFAGGVVDGSRGSVSVGLPGMGNLALTLHFRVNK